MIEARIVEASWRLAPGVFYEESIEPIGDREPPDRESVNEDTMNRAFILRACIAAHQEITGRYKYHFWCDDHRAMSNAWPS
jgi:hypothetical protein